MNKDDFEKLDSTCEALNQTLSSRNISVSWEFLDKDKVISLIPSSAKHIGMSEQVMLDSVLDEDSIALDLACFLSLPDKIILFVDSKFCSLREVSADILCSTFTSEILRQLKEEPGKPIRSKFLKY